MIKKIKRIIYKGLVPFIRLHKYISWKNYLLRTDEINIVIGAGGTKYAGWFDTDIDTLNVTNENDFKKYFKQKKISKILAEHVLEHLKDDELELMVKNFFKYSDLNVNIRIAVPDGFHEDKNYIENVRPGGKGEGAEDHNNLFNYKSLALLFEKHGFKSNPIEYWDENGIFHTNYKNDENGYIKRSFIYDTRNSDGMPNYTSLIVDFTK